MNHESWSSFLDELGIHVINLQIPFHSSYIEFYNLIKRTATENWKK